MVEFRLLGAVLAFVDDAVVDLGPARQRCVLAALAVDANQVVSVDRLVQRVWGERPPLRARQTLVNYVSRLRQVLAAGAATIVRRSGGYCLAVRPSTIDLHRFSDLRSRAQAEDGPRAAALLEEALGLWRGDALTGLDGEWAEAERDRLHRERLDAESDLTDLRLRLGHGKDLVAGLAARVTEHPLDERVAAHYVLALHQAGRTADALEHYRRLRERLVDELGTDPGPALQDLHRRILAADPALSTTTAEADGPSAAPRHLPAAPGLFTPAFTPAPGPAAAHPRPHPEFPHNVAAEPRDPGPATPYSDDPDADRPRRRCGCRRADRRAGRTRTRTRTRTRRCRKDIDGTICFT